jgi:Nucleotide modification associated domain 3
MKIILSRKGFDSATGKVASPIFPSGEICSLPIPERSLDHPSRTYGEITAGAQNLGNLVCDLTRGKIAAGHPAHLDPDLNLAGIPRHPDWRPLFGQAGAAESHLRGSGVKEGDVFVFYGWFRRVEQAGGRYRYVQGAPDLHVIFGWLQIERRICLEHDAREIPPWALYHPHCARKRYSKVDSLYISTPRLQLPGVNITVPGAGVFERFDPALLLTAPGMSRSTWLLPGWFHPAGKRSTLSYHGSPARWTQKEDHLLLNTVGRGQEFVLDCEEYPQALDWLRELVMQR